MCLATKKGELIMAKQEKTLEEVLAKKCIFIDVPAGMSKTENPYCKKNFNPMKVDSDDIFEMTDSKGNVIYGLKKNALFKIADLAGVQWGDCRILKSDANSVICQATAIFRGADCSFTPFSCTKEFNLLVEEKQYRDKMLKLALVYQKSDDEAERSVLGNMSAEEWATSQVKLHMLNLRKNKVAIAETGSKMRLVRTVLNIRSYTEEELKKGFYVARYDFMPDMNDPEIKRMFMEQGFRNPLFQQVNKSNTPIDVTDSAEKMEPDETV